MAILTTGTYAEFVEDASFESYGGSSRPCLLRNELLMFKRDSDGFFSTRVV